MPWTHCDAELPDDRACACGVTKEQWTVEFNVTRRFQVQRRAGRDVRVRLQVDPAEPATEDDRYTLFLTGDRARWSRTLTPKDDAEPGDRWLTLVFTGLPTEADARFSLEVDPGAEGEPYLVLDGLTHDELLEGPRATPAHDDPRDPTESDDVHGHDRRSTFA
jgi:hypothetical protein